MPMERQDLLGDDAGGMLNTRKAIQQMHDGTHQLDDC